VTTPRWATGPAGGFALLPGMPYRLLADLVVAGHALFVLFVVGGGFLAWRNHLGDLFDPVRALFL